MIGEFGDKLYDNCDRCGFGTREPESRFECVIVIQYPHLQGGKDENIQHHLCDLIHLGESELSQKWESAALTWYWIWLSVCSYWTVWCFSRNLTAVMQLDWIVYIPYLPAEETASKRVWGAGSHADHWISCPLNLFTLACDSPYIAKPAVALTTVYSLESMIFLGYSW